ncbi:uncharacterized protein LOC133737799 [Rosa rugosa]|uniref:uncharacterized protein LOC133737799 n=1 Tax=Rosa rugosa TaxID=74645 RepID=UPI002B40225B|nr:uncharacterized protein LOC133737799 [Rosa rugosa]
MIKLIFWNSRGAGSEKFRSDIVDLVNLHSIDILVICEPRIQFRKASDTLLSLRFTDYKIVEANGFSGGIWLFWDSSKINVDFIDSTSQSITTKITIPNGPSWLLTSLYASPTNSLLIETLVMGDLEASEIGLILTLSLTWDFLVLALLGLITESKRDWIELSVLLYSNNSVDRRATPFRFQAMWLTHNEFPAFVTDTWNSTHGNFVKKTADLSQALLHWNKNTFGNIFRRKKHLLARIGGIQKATDRFIIPWLFPTLDANTLHALCILVDMCEVKKAMFSIGGLKAPGFDGFPALFYQKFWSLYNAEIFSIVQVAFSSCEIPAGLNHTIISLIPKVPGPQSMVQFRPISLCSTIYKVISKIIVARIRPLMQNLISPNQVSYVPGRQISDNIMIAQELLFKFKKSSGYKGFFAWKVDLSKAYDRLSWSFIESVLHEACFPPSLVKLIMSCISSTSFQICFNGELTDSFQAHRGIRQGDPLSPYIFVLCMEKLAHLIQSAVDIGAWKAVRTSQSGPKVSHLFFGDDLMLFAEATHDQARILKQCLDIFCSLSGQAVNYEKSLIFCSPNTNGELAGDISNICGSPLTTDLGKYLGMPLIHSRVNKYTYISILDKVQSRLSGWKSKVLSMAGRLTLIHSVTATIPSYAMQTAKLPTSICDSLDKLNRNFLWGDIEDKRRVHLINWDTVCLPKSLGGLGIKKSSEMNQAMLAKAGWRLFQNNSGLWATVYKDKYLSHDNLFDANYQIPKDCSSTWRSVVHGASLLKQGLTWRVGDGKRIKFWIDIWLPPLALINYIHHDVEIDINATICSFWNENGRNINLLYSYFPDDIVSRILHTPPGFDGCGEDIQIWNYTSNGDFSVKSAYHIFFDTYDQLHSPWKFIWKMHIPPKLKTFTWVLCHEIALVFKIFGILSLYLTLNKCVFDVSFQRPRNPGMLVISAITEWITAQAKVNVDRNYCLNLLSWLKPPAGIFKLNVDGTRHGPSGKIGAGGVIRCSNGNWIKGFQVNLGIGEILDAEAWGLLHGLKQAFGCHINQIEVESDSAILVRLIKNTDVSLHPLGSLISCCRNLIDKFQSFSLRHIYRECNMVADCLAKNSITHAHGVVEFECPPIHVSQAYFEDLDNTVRMRITSVMLAS